MTEGDGPRTPDIISTSESNAVVAWREGTVPGKVDQGFIRYAYTTDGGATWSRPKVLAQETDQYAWTYVILYRAGDEIFAYIGRTAATSSNGVPINAIVAKRSTDEGHTWQDYAVTMPTGIVNLIMAGRPLRLADGTHVIPFWSSGRQNGVLRSMDLKDWTAGGMVPDPDGFKPGEPQIAVSPEAPQMLVMTARSGHYTQPDYDTEPAYGVRATSADGGKTWTSFALDTELPSYNTKGYFTKDSNGRYLAIYNTARDRQILYYKVKRPGEPWGAGQFFADGPAVTDTGTGAGWDTYAMADEYAPGKFYVTWEHDTSGIKVSKLDISDAFTNISSDFTSATGWSVDSGGGTAEILPPGELHLRSANSTDAAVGRSYGPASGFVATVEGKVSDHSKLDTTTGTGAGLAMSVSTGSRQLVFAVQDDGVYSRVSGQSTWSRVLTRSIDNDWHTWKASVDGAGRATISQDSQEAGVSWTIPAVSTAPGVRLWSSGTAADPAEAQVDSAGVARNVADSTWDDLIGWTTAANGGTAALTGDSRLRLRNANGSVSAVRQNTPKMCDFTLDFRGQLTDPSTLDTDTGVGASMAVRVDTGARRLMLTVQADGVYSMRKGQTTWSRVLATTTGAAATSWRVVTGSAGEARLYRDGTDTGATWSIQDMATTPGVQHWVSGTSSNPAEASVEWTRVTCS
ncbi:sialidase family protein [Nonomuraea sp. NPDC002799]